MAEQEPSQIKSDILMRVRGLYLVFIVVVVIVLMRLCYVQFLAPETRHNAKRLSTRIFLPDTVYAQRGSILSRDGEPLASSIFRYQPHFDFASEGFADEETFLTQSDSLAKLLSAYSGIGVRLSIAVCCARSATRHGAIAWARSTTRPTTARMRGCCCCSWT